MEDTIDDMEVSRGKPLYHVGYQVLPSSREILLANDSDGLTQLLLNGARRLEHEINDEGLDSFSVLSVDLVGAILGHRPVPLDVVLEGDGARYLMIENTNYQSDIAESCGSIP